MRWLVVISVGTGLALAGCGESATSDNARVDEGAMAVAALGSSDVHSTLCPRTSATSDRGEWATPDARMSQSESPVILEDLTPPQRFRGEPSKVWVTKAPIAVRLDGRPVEIAVMDSDGAQVGLEYDDWAAQFSTEAAYQRIRFRPCKGDKPSPTWYGWPGVIVADRENVCLKLAVRGADGGVSIQQVPLGDACAEDTA